MNVGHDANFDDTERLQVRPPESERARPTGASRRPTNEPDTDSAPPSVGAESDKSVFAFDSMSLLRPALRRWLWLFVGGALGFGTALALAMSLWRLTYSSVAQLVRHDPPVAREAFQPHPADVSMLTSRIEDPAFLRRVGRTLSPPLTSAQVLGRIQIKPERNSDLMNVIATGADAAATIHLANAFAREVVKFTQEEQRREAIEAESYVAQDLAEAESQLADAQKNMPTPATGLAATNEAAGSGAPPAAVKRNAGQIQAARDELTKLLTRYTDAHPLVRQQRAVIAVLEAEAASGVDARTVAAAASTVSATRAGEANHGRIVSREEFEIALFRLRQLESLRMQLRQRRQQIELFKANPPGGFRITMPASEDTLSVIRPWMKIGLLAALGGALGLTFAASQILFREFIDGRLKTMEDVTRVTRLPVIATLGDLRRMSITEREDWAFRTWIALQDRLSAVPTHGLICGITSSRSGDGRSTWIGLLAGAARKCGFRVLTVATKPTADAEVNAHEAAEAAASADAADPGFTAANGAHPSETTAAVPPANGRTPDRGGPVVVARKTEIEPLRGVSADSEFTAMTASALFTPAQVVAKFMGTESDPLVHIPLPGWTWNIERRKQWQSALGVWRKIENVVILVELPPASVPEAVLLASHLPNVAWLVESGKSEAAETHAQLKTLRHARCNLVGAFVNRAMSTLTQGRLARWMSCVALLAASGLSATRVAAQPAGSDAAVDANAAPAAFSIVGPAQRAEWQRRLTLGPGDILNLSLYGDPTLSLAEVPIGPDGRISYLEATDIMAAGLTVDELRDRLNQEIGKFRHEPQVIVVPVEFRSKKYYVLGKVAQRGAFTLDRPTTLIEAVALAQGVETGMSADQTLVDLADLSRSFVARNGRKLPVDFEKLFGAGDLSQNVPLEPNDYIYFPANELKEVYVLGAVERPGPYAFTSAVGALGAVSARGGFALHAWRSRMLVIRGSLRRPQTFIIDANQVLSGQILDLKLQPRDIVYVSRRPWWRAEELLDEAASAYVTAAVVVWTGLHVTE